MEDNLKNTNDFIKQGDFLVKIGAIDEAKLFYKKALLASNNDEDIKSKIEKRNLELDKKESPIVNKINPQTKPNKSILKYHFNLHYSLFIIPVILLIITLIVYIPAVSKQETYQTGNSNIQLLEDNIYRVYSNNITIITTSKYKLISAKVRVSVYADDVKLDAFIIDTDDYGRLSFQKELQTDLQPNEIKLEVTHLKVNNKSDLIISYSLFVLIILIFYGLNKLIKNND